MKLKALQEKLDRERHSPNILSGKDLLLPWVQVMIHPQHILRRGQRGCDAFTVKLDTGYLDSEERKSPDEMRAITTHIVKACNNHDALVEALQAVKALALPGATHIHAIIDRALADIEQED